MPRRFAASIVFAAAVAATTVAVAARGDDAAGEAQRQVETVRLSASSFADRDLDVRPRGLGLGDSFTASEDLFRDGRNAGHDDATCTITRLEPKGGDPETGALQCFVTLFLPEGQITAQGVRTARLASRAAPKFVLAVTGGTGAYRAARGTVRFVDLDATESRITARLV